MAQQKPLYGERDKKYFQRLERENIARSGSRATYYSLNRGQNVDPLYGEPRLWHFEKFEVDAVQVEYQEQDGRDVETRDEGVGEQIDARMRIAKLEWDAKAPYDVVTAKGGNRQRLPKAGDVIEVQREFWDVMKGNSSGNAIDRPDFTGFELTCMKRTKFTAVRRVHPQTDHEEGAS